MATTPPPRPRRAEGVERGALSPSEAAVWLGISRSVFYDKVLGDLRVVQLGDGSSSPSPNSSTG
jgi:hypothetical protein